MAEFIKVATKSDLEPGQIKLVEVDDRLIILFRSDETTFCSIDDVCTHDGGTLSDGEVSGKEIECPRHGARFDMCSGEALCMPATQNTTKHEVKVDGDDVFVKLNESE